MDLAAARIPGLCAARPRAVAACPLLVLIHGCRQKAEDIAEGTRITELADEHRMPRTAAKTESASERVGLLELVRSGDRKGLGRGRDRRRPDARGAPQLPDRPQARFRRGNVLGRRARRRARRQATRVRRRRVHSFRHRVRRSVLRARRAQRAERGADTDIAAHRARGARASRAANAAGAAVRDPGHRRRCRRARQCRAARPPISRVERASGGNAGDRRRRSLPPIT